MIIFIIYVFLVCFPALLCASGGNVDQINSTKNRKFTLLIPIVYLTLIMGLKNFSVGTDTSGYVREFFRYPDMSFEYLFSKGYAYGFYLFNKIMSYISPHNYTVYLFTVALFVGISIYYFLKCNSDDCCMSQVMLLSLGFTFFFITGIKQTIAMCILMYAYTAQKEHKRLKFVILTCLAATFHPTALIFLLILPAKIVNFRKAMVVVAPVMVAFAYVYQNQLFAFFSSIIPDDLYEAYGTSYISNNNITGLLIQLVIFFVSLVFLWHQLKIDDEASHLLTVYAIGMMFQAMTGALGEFFRISMYFSVLGVILLPKAVSKLDKRYRYVVSCGICLVFVTYFIFFSSSGSGVLPYRFFWE